MSIARHVIALLLVLQYIEILAAQETDHKRKSRFGTDGSSKEVKKSCRYTWEWESLIYGDLCLPSKSSLLPRKKSTSISRHKHRHKNKNYDDRPGKSRRTNNFNRKGDIGSLVSGAPVDGLLYEGQYQMDAPKYLNSVSVPKAI